MKHLKVIVCALVGLIGFVNIGCEQVDASLAYVGLADDRDPAWVKTSEAYEEAADAVTDASDAAMDVQMSIGETRKTLEELEAQYKIDAGALAAAVEQENIAWAANAAETSRIRQEHADQLKDTNARIEATDTAVETTASEFSALTAERVTEQ